MIQSVIDTRMKPLLVCVDAYRHSAKGAGHKPVVVDIGIDQEGTLLGVIPPNPKHPLDPAMKDCMTAALHGLPFPRSHAGIITVRQSFEDQILQQ
jgi:hypothetical protein